MEERNVENVMGAGAAPAGGVLTRRVVVANQLGLHARPAGVLAQVAQGFHADIELVLDDQTVDAKSILDILTLAAGQGAKLEVRAGGDDAQAALDRLEQLFKTRFGEDK
ncbi:MAG: HPr family phosphocarrier protein [Desulfovibrionaceae bacterium]